MTAQVTILTDEEKRMTPRIDNETLLALIGRFTTGKHPNIHYALHELAERRAEDARIRDRYEAREKLWRELARLGSISDEYLYRSIDLRRALGIDKEGA